MIGNGIGIGFQMKKKSIVSDSFNRADNASSMGNANTGQTWQVLVGTWGIISNQAYLASVTAQASAAVDAGTPNVIMTCKIKLSPTANMANTGLVARVIDNSNYLMIAIAKSGVGASDSIEIYKRDAGTFTALASLTNAGNVNGQTYVYRITVIGNNITVFRDGVQAVTCTLAGADATKFGTPTKFGIRVHNAGGVGDDGNSRFDDFTLEAV